MRHKTRKIYIDKVKSREILENKCRKHSVPNFPYEKEKEIV
jgi:hypothetical protein